jgi:hypothetical protein
MWPLISLCFKLEHWPGNPAPFCTWHVLLLIKKLFIYELIQRESTERIGKLSRKIIIHNAVMFRKKTCFFHKEIIKHRTKYSQIWSYDHLLPATIILGSRFPCLPKGTFAQGSLVNSDHNFRIPRVVVNTGLTVHTMNIESNT